ncbi:MAG: tetratricopeptide repeat protein [Deltaproteobacteria bacterium]|nr:tetratricopeptide repeat protein [Deltaproteobacteria bacterium]
MRKLVEEMRLRCESFVAQRQDLALIVKAGLSEYVPLMSTLDGLEKSDASNMFWLFADPFITSAEYVDTLANSFNLRCKALIEALKEEQSPIPPIPEIIANSQADLITRLKQLMIYARDLLPNPDNSDVIFGFLPSEINNSADYASLMLKLLQHELPIPWCHHMRIFIREDSDTAILYKRTQTIPYAQGYAPDFSPPAIEKSLIDEAHDDKLSLPLRMQSFFILAGLDLAQRRYSDAIEKYGLLSRYYLAEGNKPLAALSLNGLGEVAERGNQLEAAQDYFERALTPAIESESLPALINITLNLANLHRREQRWQQARDHYDAVAKLAQGCANPMLKIRCLEQIGFCCYKLDDKKAAFENWDAGYELAKGVEAESELLNCLERLRNLYAELGMKDEKAEAEREIKELRRRGVEASPQ